MKSSCSCSIKVVLSPELPMPFVFFITPTEWGMMPCFQCLQSWIFCSFPTPTFSQQIPANCPPFINVPPTSRCCLSSKDKRITMQAAYGQALCLRKGKSYFLSFLVHSCCALLPIRVINFILYLYIYLIMARMRKYNETSKSNSIIIV